MLNELIQIINIYHLGAFDVTDADSDAGDVMAAHKLDNLCIGGEFGVHFDRRQFDVLQNRNVKTFSTFLSQN